MQNFSVAINTATKVLVSNFDECCWGPACFPFQHSYCLAHKKFPRCSSHNSLDLICSQWDLGVSLTLALILCQVTEGCFSAYTSELPLPHLTSVRDIATTVRWLYQLLQGCLLPLFCCGWRHMTNLIAQNQTQIFQREVLLETDCLCLYCSWLVCPGSLQIFIYRLSFFPLFHFFKNCI